MKHRIWMNKIGLSNNIWGGAKIGVAFGDGTRAHKVDASGGLAGAF
jgi:hypothetical protein